MNHSISYPTQAVILAAGSSSRCIPFTSRQTHKSSFIIMGKSIIFHTLKALEKAGFTDVLIVHSPHDTQLVDSCQSALFNKLSITFHLQDKPLGMANALLSVQEKLAARFLLLNPQQVNCAEHLGQLKRSELEQEKDVLLFSQKTDQPHKYGMLQLDGTRVMGVIEKPTSLDGISNQRLLGMYILTRDFVAVLAQQPTDHYQFEATLAVYAQTRIVHAFESTVPGLTLKYAWDFFSISNYLFEQHKHTLPVIDSTATVHPTALITGPVVIEAGAHIYEYAIIHGPSFIGKNVTLGSYCKVRAGSVLEEAVELQNNVEVKHSLIGEDTHIHSGFIGDSILGEGVRIGAAFATANRRLDRKSIHVPIQGRLVDTHTSSLGAIIGDEVKIGIHSGSNPGAIITSGTTIYPGTIISNPKLL